MNVYQRLNAAREQFHSLKLEKTGENKFAKYKYFELGDFLIPAMKVFREHGLCAVVSFDADKACMLIRNVEKPEEFITIYSPMGSADLKGCHEVQNIGAVETYQRRYLWVAALEIVEHDALDATTGKEEPARQAKQRGGVAADVLATSEALPADTTAYLNELAEEVKIAFASGGAKGGFERIDVEELDHLQKIYLSTRLPSNVRNPITEYSRALHSKQREAAKA